MMYILAISALLLTTHTIYLRFSFVYFCTISNGLKKVREVRNHAENLYKTLFKTLYFLK